MSFDLAGASISLLISQSPAIPAGPTRTALPFGRAPLVGPSPGSNLPPAGAGPARAQGTTPIAFLRASTPACPWLYSRMTWHRPSGVRPARWPQTGRPRPLFVGGHAVRKSNKGRSVVAAAPVRRWFGLAPALGLGTRGKAARFNFQVAWSGPLTCWRGSKSSKNSNPASSRFRHHCGFRVINLSGRLDLSGTGGLLFPLQFPECRSALRPETPRRRNGRHSGHQRPSPAYAVRTWVWWSEVGPPT